MDCPRSQLNATEEELGHCGKTYLICKGSNLRSLAKINRHRIEVLNYKLDFTQCIQIHMPSPHYPVSDLSRDAADIHENWLIRN